MREPLAAVELGALGYVAENRLREAQDVCLLAGEGPLSAPARAYLASVERLFEAIRRQDAARAASMKE